ncbi:MerR family transcriptional regulator [Roseomonas sp. AR75]|uniref:MerR family transcriptional regulator n=1 Tax=Roseomonas sp. AR75 TaxID=2562311 RepID=UPI0010BFE3D9
MPEPEVTPEETGVGEAEATRARPRKAPTAFRTISEVADDLQIPQHVLRFWETKFPALKPLKRGGGRRYYRPEDIALLRRISDLLYTQGYTIKGVQRLLRDGTLGEEGAPELPLGAPEEAERDEADTATVALREALATLEGLAEELRALASRS